MPISRKACSSLVGSLKLPEDLGIPEGRPLTLAPGKASRRLAQCLSDRTITHYGVQTLDHNSDHGSIVLGLENELMLALRIRVMHHASVKHNSSLLKIM